MRTCRRVRTSTITTSRGLADLRGLAPAARAQRMVDRCAHAPYRDVLSRYVGDAEAVVPTWLPSAPLLKLLPVPSPMRS
jgi:succinyl-CoA:acetate CoA-transferase